MRWHRDEYRAEKVVIYCAWVSEEDRFSSMEHSESEESLSMDWKPILNDVSDRAARRILHVSAVPETELYNFDTVPN